MRWECRSEAHPSLKFYRRRGFDPILHCNFIAVLDGDDISREIKKNLIESSKPRIGIICSWSVIGGKTFACCRNYDLRFGARPKQGVDQSQFCSGS